MSTINSELCAAAAATALALTFGLAGPILAVESPKNHPTPPAATAQERPSQDAMKEGRPGCKKIYEHVHRGHPGKGTDQLKLVRVECPTPRA